MEYQHRVYGVTPGGLPVSPTSGRGFGPSDIYGRRHPLVGRSLRAEHGDDDAGDDDADHGGDGGNGDDVDEGGDEPGLHVDDGIKDIDDLGHHASGIRVTPFADDSITDAPADGDGDHADHPPRYVQTDPAQSGIAGVPPWHQDGPIETPAPQTNPYNQVWDGAAQIGEQTPWCEPDDDNCDDKDTGG